MPMTPDDPRVTAACVAFFGNDPPGFAELYPADQDLLRVMMARAIEAADAAAWRPIETAPRDGSTILVGRPGYRPETARWLHRLHPRWLDPLPNGLPEPSQALLWCPIPTMPKDTDQ